MKLSTFGELGGIVGVHAVTSKILSQSWGRKNLGGSEEEVKKRRAVICAAVALLVMGNRWQVKNKGLFAAALVTKLLNLFEAADSSCKAAICSVFFPVAAVMWAKWPMAASGAETVVHPEFTSTMGNLVGIGSRAQVVEFGKNPTVPGLSEFFGNAVRGTKWGFKALFTVYLLQGVVGWALGKKRDVEDLTKRVKKAFKKAAVTQLIYTGCATWSNVAYGYLGSNPSVLGAGPVLLFAFEPLGRLRTISEYYIAHFLYCHYQTLRQLIYRSDSTTLIAAAKSVNSAVVGIGLPAAMLMFGLLGIDPPFLSGLKSITL